MLSKYLPFLRFAYKAHGFNPGLNGAKFRACLGCFSVQKVPSGIWTFRELSRARGKARRLTYCRGQTGTVSLRKRIKRDAYLLLRTNRPFDYPFYLSMSCLSDVSKASRLTFPVETLG
jgi:hypothetical protein